MRLRDHIQGQKDHGGMEDVEGSGTTGVLAAFLSPLSSTSPELL